MQSVQFLISANALGILNPHLMRFVPGMVMTSSPRDCTQASASCPGVQFLRAAISATFVARSKFCMPEIGLQHNFHVLFVSASSVYQQ